MENNMSMLERLLRDYNKNVAFVGEGNQNNDSISTLDHPVKPENNNDCVNNQENVDFVACTREVENHLGSSSSSSSSSKYIKTNISSPCASDKSDKLKPGDCDQCPAAGYWSWYGPGLWCFHRAYFLGKSGHPKACDTAKHDCPLKMAK
jgi:hypothetical protein